MGQNGIPDVHVENGSVLKGKVLVINGRPTRACTFKLTPTFLALRVCKTEGRKRSITYLDTKDFYWPKDVNGEPEPILQSGGLVQAQPVDIVSPLKGTLVKPRSFNFSLEG